MESPFPTTPKISDLSQRELSLAVRVSEIPTEFFRQSFLKLGLEKDGKILSPIDYSFFETFSDSDRQLVINICGAARNAFFSTFSVYHTPHKIRKLLTMSQRYPWHGTDISKSDHFDFVWDAFVNECYLFEERTKIMGRMITALQEIGSVEKMDVGSWIKTSSKALRSFIKYRGINVHQWPQTHSSYSEFSLYDSAESISEHYRHFAKYEYREAKRRLKSEISSAIDLCHMAFDAFEPDPITTLQSLMLAFDKHIDTLKSK